MWEEDPEVRPKPAPAKASEDYPRSYSQSRDEEVLSAVLGARRQAYQGGQLHDEPRAAKAQNLQPGEGNLSRWPSEGTRGVSCTTSREPHKHRTFDLEKVGHWGAV